MKTLVLLGKKYLDEIVFTKSNVLGETNTVPSL